MNYTIAHGIALEKFKALTLEEIQRYSGYEVDKEGVNADFLGNYYVHHPEGTFVPEINPGGELPIFAQILVLHYLTLCRQTKEANHLISFKELPGGMIYVQPFTNRAIRPLTNYFGANPQKLLLAAQRFGGRPMDLGDVAVTIPVFPKIPVTIVLWEGDEEFPPSGNILFDASAAELLETEDYAVLASILAAKLIEQAKKL